VTDPVVLREDRGPVAVLTLNRPDRMNGWTPEMGQLYFDALEQITADDAIRAVVVTGAGRAFCAGADMGDLQTLGDGSATLTSGERPTTFPLSVPKPVVAAVNGACAGLGLVQALLCDVRIAAADAQLTTAFAKVGLVAEHGISWLLPRHVGWGNAVDLLLSARVVRAEEALRMGLVQQVCPPGEALETAVSYAQELADRVSPTAVAAIKAQLYRHATLDLGAALDDSDRLMRASLEGLDFPEGVAAFLEKRPPAFGPYRSAP